MARTRTIDNDSKDGGGWSSVMRVGTAVVDNEGEGKGEEGT